jgi:DNA replication licensing factor MCM7
LRHRHYIAQARLKRPTVPPAVSSYIVDSYVRLRKLSKDEAAQKKSHTYTSARTLLGVLRLAQALARLRFADIVEHGDVDEALRLMECSKESLDDDEDKEYEPDRSVVSQIFRLIKNMAGEGGRKRRKRPRKFGKGPGGERDMDIDSDEEDDDDDDGELVLIDIRSRVLGAGYTEAQLNDTIAEVNFVLLSRLVPHSFFSCTVRIHRRLGTRGEWFETTVH